MTKDDLIASVAVATGSTKVDAAKAVSAVIDSITAAMKAGEEVRLTGFGTFSVSARPARTGRNPSNGAEIQIPASKAPKFSPGKGLKDAVNG